MIYKILDNLNCCSDADVENLMHKVSPERQQKAKRIKHLKGRWTCLKTYEMLSGLLQLKHPLPNFSYNSYGKPFIEGLSSFSISHCPTAIAVAVADNENDIGIDIEQIRTYNPSLTNRVMNHREIEIIEQSDNKEAVFTLFWTLKEAFLKFTGTGIISELTDTLSFLTSKTLLYLSDGIANHTNDSTQNNILIETVVTNNGKPLRICVVYNEIIRYILTIITNA